MSLGRIVLAPPERRELKRRARKRSLAVELVKRRARMRIPDDLQFSSCTRRIESELKRTIENRDTMMCRLNRAVYWLRDVTLVEQRNDSFDGALRNLYREFGQSENLSGSSADS